MKAVVTWLLVMKALSINIRMCKENVFLGNGDWYEFKVAMLRSNADLISSAVSVTYVLGNSIPSTSQYFDYLPYLSPED